MLSPEVLRKRIRRHERIAVFLLGLFVGWNACFLMLWYAR